VSITPGEIALTRIRASERASVSAAAFVIATASVPAWILKAATPDGREIFYREAGDPAAPAFLEAHR
jgi:hypothetical protein